MDRCYRPAFDDDQALKMLREQRGRAFDPRIVDAFIGAAEDGRPARRASTADPARLSD
jgi:putative two-component system response regulator